MWAYTHMSRYGYIRGKIAMKRVLGHRRKTISSACAESPRGKKTREQRRWAAAEVHAGMDHRNEEQE